MSRPDLNRLQGFVSYFVRERPCASSWVASLSGVIAEGRNEWSCCRVADMFFLVHVLRLVVCDTRVTLATERRKSVGRLILGGCDDDDWEYGKDELDFSKSRTLNLREPADDLQDYVIAQWESRTTKAGVSGTTGLTERTLCLHREPGWHPFSIIYIGSHPTDGASLGYIAVARTDHTVRRP